MSDTSSESEVDQPRATRSKAKQIWVMRSGPSRSADYDAVQGEDVDQGAGYSDEEKGQAGRGAQDDPGYDTEASDEQPRKERPGTSKKKIWLWVGVAAIVLLLILLAIYFFWLRSRPDEQGSSKSSSLDASNASSAGNGGAASSTTAVDASSSNGGPATTSGLVVASSLADLAPTSAAVASGASLAAVGSVSRATTTPTKTATAINSATTYFAQITWYDAEDKLSACNTKPNDGDYVVQVSKELYGDMTAVSDLCGRWLSIYQLETDSYTHATIQGVCTTCTGHNINLSRATFWALTQNMKLGTTLVQWWFSDAENQGRNTIKTHASAAAPVQTGATASSPSYSSSSSSIGQLEDVSAEAMDGGSAEDGLN
ncbi:hypothetical protein JCM10212_006050 [Sporobolomyces blumeae]